MNKQEFLTQLRKRLAGLPQDDIEERLLFYSEMIDDRIEEGLTEEAAICAIGTMDELVSQIVSETPITKLVKEKLTPKKSLKTWEIVLLILGSPIWLTLLIAALIVILSLYITLWSLIISFWAVFGSLVIATPTAIALGIGFALSGNVLPGIAVASAGITCAGLGIFCFFGCRQATKGALFLTGKIAFTIKNCFMKKEDI